MTNELKKWFRKNGRKAGKASAAKLTPEQRTARARKAINARWARRRLIHWSGTPAGVCERKDAGTDRIETPYDGGRVKIINSAEADHIGNVTCKVCREYAKKV